MKPKKLPRLWCAVQGLLPLDACLAAQRAELAWPRERSGPEVADKSPSPPRRRKATESSWARPSS
jgi:hypothetical protein